MIETAGQLIYPGAVFRPLGPQTERMMSAHDIVCVHTMDGYLTSTDEMFRQGGYTGVESHFGIGGPWGSDADRNLDGAVWQWQDVMRVADANLDGNSHVISIEHADNAPRSASGFERFTDAQVLADIALIRWLCDKATHAGCPPAWECHKSGIPMTLVPDSKPGRRGLAVHRQGIKHSEGYGIVGVAGVKWLVVGGERWSQNVGKECPSDIRIKQFVEEMIPALNAGGEDWLTMATEQDVQNAVAAAVTKALGGAIVPNTEYRPTLIALNPKDLPRVTLEAARAAIDARGAAHDIDARLGALETAIGAMQGQLNALQAAFTQLNDRVAEVLNGGKA